MHVTITCLSHVAHVNITCLSHVVHVTMTYLSHASITCPTYAPHVTITCLSHAHCPTYAAHVAITCGIIEFQESVCSTNAPSTQIHIEFIHVQYPYATYKPFLSNQLSFIPSHHHSKTHIFLFHTISQTYARTLYIMASWSLKNVHNKGKLTSLLFYLPKKTLTIYTGKKMPLLFFIKTKKKWHIVQEQLFSLNR